MEKEKGEEKVEKEGRAEKGNDPIPPKQPLTPVALKLQPGLQLPTALSGCAKITKTDTHVHTHHARINTLTQPESRRFLTRHLSKS